MATPASIIAPLLIGNLSVGVTGTSDEISVLARNHVLHLIKCGNLQVISSIRMRNQQVEQFSSSLLAFYHLEFPTNPNNTTQCQTALTRETTTTVILSPSTGMTIPLSSLWTGRFRLSTFNCSTDYTKSWLTAFNPAVEQSSANQERRQSFHIDMISV